MALLTNQHLLPATTLVLAFCVTGCHLNCRDDAQTGRCGASCGALQDVPYAEDSESLSPSPADAAEPVEAPVPPVEAPAPPVEALDAPATPAAEAAPPQAPPADAAASAPRQLFEFE